MILRSPPALGLHSDSTRRRFRVAVAAALSASFWLVLGASPPGHANHSIPRRNLDVVGHFNDFPPASGARYSSCWHYVHGDGREYAIIGHQRGIGIYNVTNPHAAYLVD